MNIFIVNGAPGSGKTSFESFVKMESKKQNIEVEIYSTIDFVKDIAKQCGWDGQKTLENRRFLSDLKDLLTKWNDVPFKKTLDWLESVKFRLWQYDVLPQYCIIFIDCREPAEIKRLCDATGAKSLLIRREEVENKQTSNHADRDVFEYDYDIIINNNGTLDDLKTRAFDFIEKDLA